MTTLKVLGLSSLTLALAFTAATAVAHHSRANFDLAKVVEFDGTVLRFEWTNPHTAIVVSVPTPDGKTVTKTVEGNAIATMMRRGFKRDSVKPGDRVHIVANPETAAGSQFYYLNSISVNGVPLGGGDGPGRGAGNQGRTSDPDTDAKPRVTAARQQALATTMSRSVGRDSAKPGLQYSYSNAAFVSRAPGGRIAARSEQQASNADAQAIRRFVGVWRQGGGAGGGGRGARGNAGEAADAGRGDRGGGARGAGARGGGGNAILLGRPMPSNLPVTERGAASYAKFDYADDPRNDCVPESLPAAISSAPYLFGIRQEGGNLVFENENYAAARVIHMGQSRPPAGTRSDYDGYSVGRIEDGVLVVETTLFSSQPWGNDTGLDSSEQKHMVEWWSVTDGGQRLQVTYVQTDPVYLSKPVTRTVTWTSTNDALVYVWEVSTCSPEAGNRHLTEGHNPFEKKP